MTELEQRLTAALQELSEHYATEQRQLSERVQRLNEQVEQLSGQVLHLSEELQK